MRSKTSIMRMRSKIKQLKTRKALMNLHLRPNITGYIVHSIWNITGEIWTQHIDLRTKYRAVLSQDDSVRLVN